MHAGAVGSVVVNDSNIRAETLQAINGPLVVPLELRPAIWKIAIESHDDVSAALRGFL
jgi:hypothetical protein